MHESAVRLIGGLLISLVCFGIAPKIVSSLGLYGATLGMLFGITLFSTGFRYSMLKIFMVTIFISASGGLSKLPFLLSSLFAGFLLLIACRKVIPDSAQIWEIKWISILGFLLGSALLQYVIQNNFFIL